MHLVSFICPFFRRELVITVRADLMFVFSEETVTSNISLTHIHTAV